MPQTKSAPQTLREHAQSKRVSTFHKSHFIWKFTGNMLQTRAADFVRDCAVETHVKISQETLYAEIYK